MAPPTIPRRLRQAHQLLDRQGREDPEGVSEGQRRRAPGGDPEGPLTFPPTSYASPDVRSAALTRPEGKARHDREAGVGNPPRGHPRRRPVPPSGSATSCASRARGRERRRRVHDPVLRGAVAARHPDRLGRVDDGALRRAQRLPLRARDHGRHRPRSHRPATSASSGCSSRSRLHATTGSSRPGPAVRVGVRDGGGIGLDAPIADRRSATRDVLRLRHRRERRRRRCPAARPARSSSGWSSFALNIWFVARGLSKGHREVLLVGDAGDGGAAPSSCSCAC